MLGTVDDVVDALDGTAAVAALCNVGSTAVSNWRFRGRIPSDKFLIFEAALHERGHEAERGLFTFEPAEARA